jgi:hypothetical protein
MTRQEADDLRTAALDAYLTQQEADGYRIETRTAVQAVISRRRWDIARRFPRTSVGERRLVVSVDEHGVVSAIVAAPRRW